MPDDRVAATLAGIRQNHADSEAARGLWDLSDRADVFYSSVMDVPPLLKAVEAVLKYHRRFDRRDGEALHDAAHLRAALPVALCA